LEREGRESIGPLGMDKWANHLKNAEVAEAVLQPFSPLFTLSDGTDIYCFNKVFYSHQIECFLFFFKCHSEADERG